MKLIYELDLEDTGTPYVLKAAALFREAARALEMEANPQFPGPVVSTPGHEFKTTNGTMTLVAIEDYTHAR